MCIRDRGLPACPLEECFKQEKTVQKKNAGEGSNLVPALEGTAVRGASPDCSVVRDPTASLYWSPYGLGASVLCG